MKGSLLVRVFAGYVILIIGLSVVVLLVSFRVVRTNYTHTLAAGLRNLGLAIALDAAPLTLEDRHDELGALARGLGQETDTRITIIDTAGVVLADSHEDPASMKSHATRPEVMRALRGEEGEATRLSETVNRRMLYVAVPMRANGEVIGAVRTSAYVSDISGMLHGLEKSIAGLAVIIVVVCLVGAFILSRSLTRPIGQLSAAAHEVGSGDFDGTVILKGPRELRQLGESFNLMTERMKALVADLSRKQDELAGIISSIHDALVVIDSAGKISLANQSFCRVVRAEDTGTQNVEGRFYWEVLRAPEFGDLVRAVSAEREGIEREMSIGERTFAASGGRLGRGGNVVVLFHDITAIKSLEQIKRDFIVNLSHELRTPLTAIKGFAETLEDEADLKAKGHLEVIRRHTDRLIAIVNDLLSLSELEDKSVPLPMEKVDLRPVAEDALRMFDARVKQTDLRLALEICEGPHVVMGDAFKLEQVFVNLIDNALKYTERGTITVSLRGDGKRVTVEVADTGVGIAPEHLPRIFERFYVVDKSRSKKVGGTGLGLAIVKHIVLMHNGEIDVESTPSKGTKFTVTLPAYSS